MAYHVIGPKPSYSIGLPLFQETPKKGVGGLCTYVCILVILEHNSRVSKFSQV